MKRIVVIGGGISGLALLWYLRKRHGSAASLTLLERSNRLGGWINSYKKEGFLFERGPRSCRTRGSGKATLRLIEELGLQKQVIVADQAARQRFLYLDKHLQKIPSHLFSLLFSPLTRQVAFNLFKEWQIPPGENEDETIHAFFTRRLGSEAAENFLDPLTSGIYGGNIHELSIKSCFPDLFQWERQHGSLTKGAFLHFFTNRQSPSSLYIKRMCQESLFSFKEGMQTLSNALAQNLHESILHEQEVTELNFQKKGIELGLAQGKTLWADQVYSTLPPASLAALIRPHHLPLANLLSSIANASIAVVGLGYKQKLLTSKGFGYLIPSKEKEEILGMVWDSCIFPQQSLHSLETRLTVMIGGTRMSDFSQRKESDFLNSALKAISNHLQFHAAPDVVDIHLAQNAIPQYLIGHEQKKMLIGKYLQELSPHLQLLGSAFNGVSVNDCIAQAYSMAYSRLIPDSI
ncbi:Protoporphyrinogen oxidase [Neochlamydia sp. AcF65]|uniref:protoporphyrinogen oxidase n=1 Tax=Neochlamydia sp. AcF65 TaxID=2795735 RepID=UPI001BC9491A|nr:protoporphyrinogen oxidase [Neochlamydia sp. AcF65]MBS4166267.1 Protoporphyrinogen oxidase [Neochlamydia sp. AcF65]